MTCTSLNNPWCGTSPSLPAHLSWPGNVLDAEVLSQVICELKSNGNEEMLSKFAFTELLFLITLSLAPGALICRLFFLGLSDSCDSHAGNMEAKVPLQTKGSPKTLIWLTQAKTPLASVLRIQAETLLCMNFRIGVLGLHFTLQLPSLPESGWMTYCPPPDAERIQ